MKCFVLGGAKSGKSSYAQARAEEEFRTNGRFGRLCFLATAQAGDEEMEIRIRRHQDQRGDEWETIEEPLEIAGIIEEAGEDRLILVDCLTVWLSNVMARDGDRIRERMEILTQAIGSSRAGLIIVANEVGMGIVPANPLAREFRDHAGRLNQMVGNAVPEVYFVAAGIPLKLK